MTSESSSNDTQSTVTTSVFRTASEPTESVQEPQTPQKPIDPKEVPHTPADGLYVGYEIDNGVPYVADFYGVGDTYRSSPDTYREEVESIDNYLNELIQDGEIDNSLQAVSARLKQLEKLSGVDKSERTVMKLIRLAEYCKFMNNIDNAKKDLKRYGSSR